MYLVHEQEYTQEHQNMSRKELGICTNLTYRNMSRISIEIPHTTSIENPAPIATSTEICHGIPHATSTPTESRMLHLRRKGKQQLHLQTTTGARARVSQGPANHTYQRLHQMARGRHELT